MIMLSLKLGFVYPSPPPLNFFPAVVTPSHACQSTSRVPGGRFWQVTACYTVGGRFYDPDDRMGRGGGELVPLVLIVLE